LCMYFFKNFIHEDSLKSLSCLFQTISELFNLYDLLYIEGQETIF
jgi:hypothetical protein